MIFREYHVWVSVVALALFFCFSSCRRQDPAADRVRVARAALQNSETLMESHPDGTESQKYAIIATRKALLKLGSSTPGTVHDPFPVMAEFGRVSGTKDGLSLRVCWVDPEIDVTGIFIVKPDRTETAFPRIVKWTANERDQMRFDRYLRKGFPVEFDERSTQAWAGIAESSPPLTSTTARFESWVMPLPKVLNPSSEAITMLGRLQIGHARARTSPAGQSA